MEVDGEDGEDGEDGREIWESELRDPPNFGLQPAMSTTTVTMAWRFA